MKMTAEMDGLTRIFNKKHMEQTLTELVYRTACAAYDQRAAGQGAARADPLRVPLRHRPLQALQRHERPPRRRQAPAGARRARARERPQGRHLRPLRRRGVPARSCPTRTWPRRLAAANKIRAWSPPTRSPSRRSSRSRCISVSGGVAEYPLPRPRRRGPAPRRRRGPLRGQAQRAQPRAPARPPRRLRRRAPAARGPEP